MVQQSFIVFKRKKIVFSQPTLEVEVVLLFFSVYHIVYHLSVVKAEEKCEYELFFRLLGRAE